MAFQTPIVVTGATGRLGAVLRKAWFGLNFGAIPPIWQRRTPFAGDWLFWDMLATPYPGPSLRGGVVLNLAGVTQAHPQDLEDNTRLAQAAWQAAVAQQARHVFLVSTAAVYGPGVAGRDLTEATPPNPISAYGIAKLGMERAALSWQRPGGPGLTILRIGNVLGSDALIGGVRPGKTVVLDPVAGSDAGSDRGPLRSYIGPRSLALVLAQLCDLAGRGAALPSLLNIAEPQPVAMADLLDAAGVPWQFGPENKGVVPRVCLGTAALQGLVTLPPAEGRALRMVEEWRGLTMEAE